MGEHGSGVEVYKFMGGGARQWRSAARLLLVSATSGGEYKRHSTQVGKNVFYSVTLLLKI